MKDKEEFGWRNMLLWSSAWVKLDMESQDPRYQVVPLGPWRTHWAHGFDFIFLGPAHLLGTSTSRVLSVGGDWRSRAAAFAAK